MGGSDAQYVAGSSPRAQLLDAEAANRQAHGPAPFPAVEELPDYADVTKELARRASAAAPTAAQLFALQAA